MNRLGAARIAFGQYKSWQVGIHNADSPTAHAALKQVGELTVHRDLNKDGKRTGDRVFVGAASALTSIRASTSRLTTSVKPARAVWWAGSTMSTGRL